MHASAARKLQMNSTPNADLQASAGTASVTKASGQKAASSKKAAQEKPPAYNPDELRKVVCKRKGVGLGAGLEYRQFVSKYSHTATGDKCKAQLRSEAFLNPGGPRAHKPKRTSRLKRMQNRNFVVSFVQNLFFIPTQAFHRLFAA